MNSAIEQMLKSYHVENIYDRKNAMKEIMQEIVLCGLSLQKSGVLRRNRPANLLRSRPLFRGSGFFAGSGGFGL